MADDSRAPLSPDARPDPTLPDTGNTPAPLPAQAAPQPTVRLQVAIVAKLNLADFQNALPALRELAVANDTEATLSDLTLTVSAEPPFLQPKAWHLDTVGAGATYHLTALDVTLDGALLSRLTEAEPATLRFALTSTKAPGTVLVQHDQAVELLPRNQWGGTGQLPEMVAAFVQPNDPAVARLLKAAAGALQAGGELGAIDGYARAPSTLIISI